MRDEQQILNRALSLHQKGDVAGAAKLYRRIITANPANRDALHFLGVAEAANGNIERAKSLIDRSLQSNPVNVQFIENYAAILLRVGEHDATIELCQRGLRLAPTSDLLLQASAASLSARGRHEEAIERLNKLVAQRPGHFQAQFMLGSSLAKAKQYQAALASYDRALQLNPQFAEAHLDKGTIHLNERRHAEALAAYDRALAIRSDYAEAWLGRGYALIRLGRHDEALTATDKALALRPEFAEAWVGRGNALLDQRRLKEAALAYDNALRHRPDLAAAWSGHGEIHLRSGRHAEAEKAFTQAVAADSSFAEAWFGRGNLALSLGDHEGAVSALDHALALDPNQPNAWLVRGQVHYLLKNYDNALRDWNAAISLDPNLPGAAAACQRVRMHLCDWSGFETACEAMRASVRQSDPISPFMFVAIPSSPAEQLQCSRTWIDRNFRSADHQPVYKPRSHDRIRIGYLSADFHQHATTHLMAGVFEQHDKSSVETYGISFGPDDQSGMRRRIVAAFEHFVDVRRLGDDEVADLIRSFEIDILVDLKGFTQDSRTGILARRPAPIQVNYLGFPGTIGADFIDYVIADRDVIPEHEFDDYAEKVVWLPDSYQANDRGRPIADQTHTRAEHGLPDTAFVFCCFNDTYKILPAVFAGWMRILLAVEGSVLWLFEENTTAADNLRREAAARGVVPERLVFARRLPNPEHLARHRCADLFLDTLPYGAHTTASDALWSGLPVVTLRGDTFAGRVGASLLNAVHLPELIATTADAYEELAISLATNPAGLAAIREKLARQRLTTPLFDTGQLTRHLEAAYAAMMARREAGLPPDHIRVPRPVAGAPQSP